MEQIIENARCAHCAKQVPQRFLEVHQHNCLVRKNRAVSKIKKSPNKSENIIEKKEQYALIPCSECGQMFPFQEFALHYQQCPGLQNQKCSYCKDKYPKYLIEQHYHVCQAKRQHDQSQIINHRGRINQENPLRLNSQRVNIFQALLGMRGLGSFENQREQDNGPTRNLLMLALLLRGLGGQQGLQKEQIQKLKETKAKQGDGNCTVCYCQLENNQKIYRLHCGHKFHSECLKPWLQKNTNCPLCRKHVLGKEQEE